jgi:hypothetical protein
LERYVARTASAYGIAVDVVVLPGLQELGDFALQVPTVALALAIGVIASKRWRERAVHRLKARAS